MKKQIIAMAVAAAAAACAQAGDVNVYGAMDTGLTYTHQKDTDSLAMTSGNYAGPRFGLKGAEDLGNGYKMKFILEAGFADDTGAMGKQGSLFNRESQLAVETPYGTVGFGRFGAFTSGSSSMSWYWDMEPFETGYNHAGTQATMNNIWTLHSNAMYYVSPTFAGAKFGIQYGMSGDDDKEADKWNDRSHWLNAAVRWDAETVHVLAGVESMIFGDNKTAGEEDYDTFVNGKFAVSWDAMPDLRLYAGAAAYRNARTATTWGDTVAMDNTKTGRGLTGYAGNLGVRYTIGAADLLAQVQYLSGKNKAPVAYAETDKFSRVVSSIGCHYHFSGRTMAYAVASYTDDQKLLKDNVTYVHLGLTHFF